MPAVRRSDNPRRSRLAGASRATAAAASPGLGIRRFGLRRVHEYWTAWPGWRGNPRHGKNLEGIAQARHLFKQASGLGREVPQADLFGRRRRAAVISHGPVVFLHIGPEGFGVGRPTMDALLPYPRQAGSPHRPGSGITHPGGPGGRREATPLAGRCPSQAVGSAPRRHLCGIAGYLGIARRLVTKQIVVIRLCPRAGQRDQLRIGSAGVDAAPRSG